MLLDQIQSDLALAQKARDQLRVDTLRFLLGAVFNLQIEKYPPGSAGSITDSDILSVIAKQVKNHEESIVMFDQGKRPDLVERERAEKSILVSYLPQPLTEAEVRAGVAGVISANPGGDFGTLMKIAMAKFSGKAPGATVARLVRELKS